MRKYTIFMTVTKADRRKREHVSKPREVDTSVESGGGWVLNVRENVIDRLRSLHRRMQIAVSNASLGTYAAFNSNIGVYIQFWRVI
jgi:hypothetical protein